MIICPFCQTAYIDNTLFCDECGTYLAEEKKRDTFPLEEELLSPPIISTSETALNATHVVVQSSLPPTLLIEIGEKNRTLEISLSKTIYIGRIDPAANIYPEIDLSAENGLENGVSRQHIRILYRSGQVFIEDLGSINGTTINDRRLLSYLPEPLSSGDILMLGYLKISVQIQPQ